HVVEPGVLGADARVVETGGDRMRFGNLAVAVHQQVGAVAVQHAGLSAGNRSSVLTTGDAVAGGFDAVNLDAGFVEKGMEKAHGIGATADAGDERIRQPAFGPSNCSRVSRPMMD